MWRCAQAGATVHKLGRTCSCREGVVHRPPQNHVDEISRQVSMVCRFFAACMPAAAVR